LVRELDMPFSHTSATTVCRLTELLATDFLGRWGLLKRRPTIRLAFLDALEGAALSAP